MTLVRLLAAALVAAPALAQPAEPDSTESPLRPGVRALMFQTSDLSLSGFDGASLSLKLHRSATRAARFGLSATVFVQSTDARGVELDATETSVRFTVLPVSYTSSRTRLAPYVGLGPELSVRTSVREAYSSTSPTPDERSTIQLGLGLVGVVGVEWPLNDAVSVSGEYGQRLSGSLDFGDAEGVTIQFAPRGARLGVSAYF